MQIRLASLARNCGSQFETSVQCVRTSQSKWSAPRRVGPCRPQCFSTNSAEQSSALVWELELSSQPPVPGAQTASASQIRTAGNCVGKRRQSCSQCSVSASMSHLSLSVSRVCAPLLRARVEYGDSGPPGKESTLASCKNTRNLTHLSLVSSRIPWILCPTAVSRLKIQQAAEAFMSSPAKPWEVDAQERSRRARSLLVQAALWAPSMAELGHNPRGSRGAPRPRRDGARSLALGQEAPEHQLSPAQPVVRRSETGQTAPPSQR